MKMIQKVIFFSFILLLPIFTFGNGGSIHSSLFKQTGNIKIINSKSIALVKEDLLIDISNVEEAVIEVDYYLYNQSKDTSVMYAFPVDFYLDIAYEPLVEAYSDLETLIRKVQYSMSFNGQPVAVKFTESEAYAIKYQSDADSILRVWFISEINLNKDTENKLRIHYTVPTEYRFSNFIEPALDYEIYDGGNNYKFTYDMYPAQCWADGQVDKLNVTVVKPKDIDDFRVNKAGFFKEQSKDTLLWAADHYKFNRYSKLIIEYSNINTSHYNKLVGLNQARDVIKKMTVSSTLTGNYDKSNLIDGNFNTAWVEGKKGEGVGEWIEIELDSTFLLTGLAIVNGYVKDEDTYRENSSIKSGEIVLSGLYYDGQSRIDSNHIERSPFDLRDYRPLENEPAEALERIEFLDYAPLEDPELIYLTEDQKIKEEIPFFHPNKIKIHINDVSPGTTFEDTCISELLVFGFYDH